MILNINRIKTQALLTICKELILAYRDNENLLFDIDNTLESYIKNSIDNILKELQKGTKPYEFYLKNRNNSYTKIFFLAYNHLKKLLEDEFKNGSTFNPSMLVFALLSTWFAELQKESKNKEYIYFILFPYAIFYDKLLLNIKDERFKTLNVLMINVAEKVAFTFDNYSFK